MLAKALDAYLAQERCGMMTYTLCVEGSVVLTYGVIAMLSVGWLIMIGLGHRGYEALILPGVIVVICIGRACLDVRRGLSWFRRVRA